MTTLKQMRKQVKRVQEVFIDAHYDLRLVKK